MTDEQYATKNVNGFGKIKWQPRDPDRGELIRSSFGGWTVNGMGWTVLYRSRSRAIRVGKREERRRLKNNWTEVDG